MCDETYDLLYFVEPPFVSQSNGTELEGVVFDMVIRSLRACCAKPPKLKLYWYDNQEVMLADMKNRSLIAVPVSFTETMLQSNPPYYIRSISSSGVSFISSRPISVGVVSQAMQSSWPLLVLILLMTGYAGFLLWLAEYWGTSSDRKIPKPFFYGYFESCYCAFVTATTVGYGDYIPKTPFGKSFVMLWTFFGIAVISAFTASMTTLLTSEQAELSEKSTIPLGQRIGVMTGSLTRQLVVQAGSYPVERRSFGVLHNLLHEKNISGIVLNNYMSAVLASHVNESFDIDICHVGVVSTGFVFKTQSEDGNRLRECMKEYNLLRSQEQDYKLLAKLSHRPRIRQKPVDLAASSIKRIVSGETLAWLTGSLILMLLIVAAVEMGGRALEKRRHSRPKQTDTGNSDMPAVNKAEQNQLVP